MNIFELNKKRPIHLSGIGGSAMNGLAQILSELGYAVHGTDPTPSPSIVDTLGQLGINIDTCQDGSRIHPDSQLLIATAALKSDHPELQTAQKRNIPIIKYATALGGIVNHTKGIAVAGTHGKTSTTALLVSALKTAHVNPGFIIGGHVPEFGTSAALGGKNIFVAEACEYDRSFLNLHPQTAIITNIEEDHLDIYTDLADIQNTFEQLVSQISPGGALIYNADCPNTAPILNSGTCKKLSFSVTQSAHYQAKNIVNKDHFTHFDIYVQKQLITSAAIKLPGEHNVANALAAFAVGHNMGLDASLLAQGLQNLQQLNRRFDIKCTTNGITVVDDYAHHPTEILALLSGAKKQYPQSRLVIAFQPHQISRTQFLLDKFATAFDAADVLFTTDIFAARDKITETTSLCALELNEKIRRRGTTVEHICTLDDLTQAVYDVLKPGDVFISIGAGSITQVSTKIAKKLSLY